jgi:hypothetical protein
MAKAKKISAQKEAANYSHPQADMAVRPEIGTQAQFKKHKPPQNFRYDSSISPALDWDAQNPAREQGETLIEKILAQASNLPSATRQPVAEFTMARDAILEATRKLKSLSKPFLNLVRLDVFDPVTMEVEHRMGAHVPTWFLDADYNGLVFHVSQTFFPRQIAVKVIDGLGNELPPVKKLEERK